MKLLRLLTLQILEGRVTIDQAKAIVIARAAARREKSIPLKARVASWSPA